MRREELRTKPAEIALVVETLRLLNSPTYEIGGGERQFVGVIAEQRDGFSRSGGHHNVDRAWDVPGRRGEDDSLDFLHGLSLPCSLTGVVRVQAPAGATRWTRLTGRPLVANRRPAGGEGQGRRASDRSLDKTSLAIEATVWSLPRFARRGSPRAHPQSPSSRMEHCHPSSHRVSP